MLQKTELLKVTVEDLDGEPEAPEAAPVNILRGKTFNPELSSLLNKIYSHEKIVETAAPVTEEIDPGLKITLLQRCDQLLYKLKHLDDAASVTSQFNPFPLDINVYDDVDDLNDYIEAGMRQSGFSRFLIMKYNFKDAAFRTDLNRIHESLDSDLFFSTRDPFFNYMYSNNTGRILDNASVNSDIFMRKKLGEIFQAEYPGKVVYFARLCDLCAGDAISYNMKNSLSTLEQYLSPIIAVLPDTVSEHYEETVFFETLKRNMQIPFSIYIMKNRLTFDSAAFSYEDTLLMLELVINSPAFEGMECSIITLDNFSVKENMFLLKLLLSRIKKRLEKNSFFMRIGMNKSILISSEREKKDISGMISEINIADEIVSMKTIDTGSGPGHDSFTGLFL